MGNQPDFRAQAARCRADADAATLENVRERNLRAEAAWLEMATRQESIATQKANREAAALSVPQSN